MSRYLGQIVLRNNVDHMMLCLQVAGKRKRKKNRSFSIIHSLARFFFSLLFLFVTKASFIILFFSFSLCSFEKKLPVVVNTDETRRGREREKKRNQRWVYKQASTQYLPHSSHHLVLIHLLSFFHIVFVDDYNYARMK